METQGLSVGSIRNSHREIHAVKRKFAPALFQELARKLVESCSEDLVLRQRLDPERVQVPLKRGEFYVMENEGRAEPGFVVFLPGKPAIYLQYRRGKMGEGGWKGNTLRMRVSSALSEGGGSVLVATLDDVLHRLRLEDVWMWRGTAVIRNEGFSKRRQYLKEFVQHHWVPDARLLGGIFTSIAQPISLEEFANKKSWEMCHSVEFIPETVGRRRMVWFLEAQLKAAEAHAGLKQARGLEHVVGRHVVGRHVVERHVVERHVVERHVVERSLVLPQTQTQRVRVQPVDSLPDVYQMYNEGGAPVGQASVQQFSLSMKLRGACESGVDVWATATWNKEFSGYMITNVE